MRKLSSFILIPFTKFLSLKQYPLVRIHNILSLFMEYSIITLYYVMYTKLCTIHKSLKFSNKIRRWKKIAFCVSYIPHYSTTTTILKIYILISFFNINRIIFILSDRWNLISSSFQYHLRIWYQNQQFYHKIYYLFFYLANFPATLY